jgi:hypothetical protein
VNDSAQPAEGPEPIDENGSAEAAPAGNAKAAAVPRTMLFAAVLVGIEALALLVFGVAALLNAHSSTAGLGITNGIFFLLYAAGLGFAAWGLSRARRWSRSPVLIAQVIQLGVAYSFAGHNTVAVAVVLAVVAIPVLVILFIPSTTDALWGPRDDDA